MKIFFSLFLSLGLFLALALPAWADGPTQAELRVRAQTALDGAEILSLEQVEAIELILTPSQQVTATVMTTAVNKTMGVVEITMFSQTRLETLDDYRQAFKAHPLAQPVLQDGRELTHSSPILGELEAEQAQVVNDLLEEAPDTWVTAFVAVFLEVKGHPTPEQVEMAKSGLVYLAYDRTQIQIIKAIGGN